MISAAPGTAETPRAHVTNMAALECLRDIDLDKQCIEAGAGGDHMLHTRWCHSMAGEEYARLYSWGNDPKRKVSCPYKSPTLMTIILTFDANRPITTPLAPALTSTSRKPNSSRS
jgi:hypothetical protein